MVNKLVKSLAAIGAAGLVVVGLAGCGNDNGDGGSADDCTVEAPCEITFRWWGGEERQALQLEAIDYFHEVHPEIRVTALPVSFDGYFDTLSVEMAGGNAPDVFTLGGAWPLEYGALGGLANVMDIPTLDMSPFSAAVLNDATQGSNVWGVPTGGNAQALVINLDIFEQAGVDVPDENTWTWEDFVSIAEEISANTPDGVFGAEMRGQDLLGAYAGQRGGGGVFNWDGEINVSVDTLVAFFDMFLELQDNGGSPGATLATELSGVGPEETLMGRGLAGMFFAPSNQITAFTESSGANLALLRIPGESEFAEVGTAVLPSQWFAISADSSNIEAAGVFVDFMVNNVEAGRIMGPDRGNPLNAEVAEAIAPDLTPAQEQQVYFMARVSEHAGAGVPQPAGAGEMPGIFQRQMDAVLFDQITPEQAAQQFLSELQTALDNADHE